MGGSAAGELEHRRLLHERRMEGVIELLHCFDAEFEVVLKDWRVRAHEQTETSRSKACKISVEVGIVEWERWDGDDVVVVADSIEDFLGVIKVVGDKNKNVEFFVLTEKTTERLNVFRVVEVVRVEETKRLNRLPLKRHGLKRVD